MVRRVGAVLIAVSIVAFIVSFFSVLSDKVPSACGGADCLRGNARWLMFLPLSVIGFVAGVIVVSYAGKGVGKTHGPKSFGDVDSGAWAPAYQREPRVETAQPRSRWSRTWRNVYMYTGLGETGLAIMFVAAGIVQPAARGGMFLTAVILGIVGVIFLVLGVRAAAKDRLHEEGVDADATILGLTQTGMWMNNNPYVRLDLEVHVPGHPPYEVKHGEIVPAVLVGRLTSGEQLHLKVDPRNPSHFVIDWGRA